MLIECHILQITLQKKHTELPSFVIKQDLTEGRRLHHASEHAR